MMVMNGKMSVTNDQSGCIKTTCGWIIGYRKENVWLTVIVDARDLQKLFDSGRQLLVGFSSFGFIGTFYFTSLKILQSIASYLLVWMSRKIGTHISSNLTSNLTSNLFCSLLVAVVVEETVRSCNTFYYFSFFYNDESFFETNKSSNIISNYLGYLM